MRKSLQELEHHSHIPFLNLINFICYKSHQFFLKHNLNARKFVHLIQSIDNYFLQLLHGVGIEHNIGNFG